MSSISLARSTRLFLAMALVAIGLSSCDNAQHTVNSLQKEISDFKVTPTPQKQQEIDQNFAKLERQIADLDKKNDDKASEFRSDLFDLRSDYQAAKMAKAVQDAKNAIQGFGQAFKDGAKSIENVFKSSTNN